jgi:hypothetical protein
MAKAIPQKKSKVKRKMNFSVVGIQYRVTKPTRRMIRDHLPFKVELEREPTNNHDPNALKVVIAKHFDNPYARMHLGYVRKQRAGMLSPALDAGKAQIHEAWVTSLDAEEAVAEMLVTISGPKKFLQILENSGP